MNAISAGASRFFLMNKDEEVLSFIDTGGNTFSPDRFKVSGHSMRSAFPETFPTWKAGLESASARRIVLI